MRVKTERETERQRDRETERYRTGYQSQEGKNNFETKTMKKM
jgi:hypothetical protein